MATFYANPDEENEQWIERSATEDVGFRIWHVMFFCFAGFMTIIILICCCVKIRVPRTKQEIEADYRRKKLTSKFKERLMLIQNQEMDVIDLKRDISIKDENEAEVVCNSSDALEFKDEVLHNSSQVFELKDNLEFKNEAEVVHDLNHAFEFKDEEGAEVVHNSSQAFEFKENLEFKDEVEAEVVHNSSQVIVPRDKFRFKVEQATILSQILQNIRVITLPSQVWAAHKCVRGKDQRICFSEMISIEDYNMIVRKKLILTKEAIKIFVFDRMINNDVIFSCEKVNTLAEFQDGLNKFNNLPVCGGGLPMNQVQSNFSNVLYFKDHYLNVWRHVSCPYVLPTVTEGNRLVKNRGRTCCYCHKNKRAVSNFKYRLTKIANRISRSQKALRIAANLRRRETKLKLRNQKIKQELKNARRKIKELDEEGLASQISALDISASQKLLLQECINTCKYNRKTSRHYDSEWLLLCLLLHIRGPDTYNFLRSNDILPLPAGSTVRKYLAKINIECGLDEKCFKSFKFKMQEKTKDE